MNSLKKKLAVFVERLLMKNVNDEMQYMPHLLASFSNLFFLKNVMLIQLKYSKTSIPINSKDIK